MRSVSACVRQPCILQLQNFQQPILLLLLRLAAALPAATPPPSPPAAAPPAAQRLLHHHPDPASGRSVIFETCAATPDQVSQSQWVSSLALSAPPRSRLPHPAAPLPPLSGCCPPNIADMEALSGVLQIVLRIDCNLVGGVQARPPNYRGLADLRDLIQRQLHGPVPSELRAVAQVHSPNYSELGGAE